MSQSEEPSTGSAGRRLSVITVDQVISGASNLLIAVLAARFLGVESFGLFGIIFMVYVTAQGLARAMVCEPVLVHPEEAEHRPGQVIGSAVVVGSLIALVVLASALVAHPFSTDLRNGLLVLAVSLPLLVLHDLGRYLGFATHVPSRSLVLDVVWLVLLVAAIAALFVLDLQTLTWFMVAWAGTGAVAALLVLWQHRTHRITPDLSWLRARWSFSWRYLLSFVATYGASLATTVAIAGVAGARALGGVRGALLLVRPFMTFQTASVAAGIAEIAHLDAGRDVLRRHARRTTVLTTLVAGLNLLVLLLLPGWLGRAVLGETWEVTEPLMLPAGLQIVFLALVTGPRSGLLGVRAIQKTVVIDVVSTVILLVLTVAGAALDGAVGAFWGVAIGQGVIAAIWWSVFWRHTGRSSRGWRARRDRDLAPAATVGVDDSDL
ncbi:oligosaccharide flippase family protein [Nocardioides sp. JQ2195]|uniref:oligosaccharide flippase family protein n=1 Tax=Nocardioides sp. JQ2195 TaxID=2592334 RepID=UPI00143EEE94|nr:oligosaccharide flippase family protein [Nocardioides sp. JQ2195]QIX25480.1 oligosaccharide flippase family protein [Nocardioides sp. JQ2195]